MELLRKSVPLLRRSSAGSKPDGTASQKQWHTVEDRVGLVRNPAQVTGPVASSKKNRSYSRDSPSTTST